MNVLLVTLDQFRGDCLSAAGHPVVRTPHLDRLAGEGVRLARHYSQAAPVRPGSGLPLHRHLPAQQPGGGQRHPARLPLRQRGPGGPPGRLRPDRLRLRRPGDRSPHRHGARRPPAVDLPGIPARLRRGPRPSRRAGRLAWRGSASSATTSPPTGTAALATEPDRPAEHGVSAFLSDAVIAWLERQDGPWFAHASYWRPHPPYAAAGHWSRGLRPRRARRPAGVAGAAYALLRSAGRPARPGRRGCAPGAAGPVPGHDLRRRRAAGAGPRRAAGPRDVGRHVRGGHLRPRRAARRPGDARQGRAVRVELPHPRHRARPAPPRHPRQGGHERSPRTSTCSRRSARPSASTSPPSATACRSPPSSLASSHRGGATRPTGSTTGAGSTSSGARTPGRGTAASSPSTSPWCARTSSPTCSTATARGGASTSQPTRGGAPRSPTRPWCSSTPSPC